MTEEVTPLDWVTRLADDVIAEAQERNPGETIVCASGISPSGPIHLGNFRELITPHLVADEIKRRGIDCEHILSWDDFDRFRRVPKNLAGVDDSWEQYIGMPLTSVPPPAGSPHASWADHFKAPLLEAMAATGIEVRQISQTEQYRAGVYRDQVLLAMRERFAIDKVLDQYRTLEAVEAARQKSSGKGKGGKQGGGGKAAKLTEEQAAAATEAERGSGAASEDDGSEGKAGYYPFKPFCSSCGTDFTTVTAYDDDSHELTYDCTKCGHTETVDLDTFTNGKLVWKVDWPMRWGHEHVMFEPSGVDHQSPGSQLRRRQGPRPDLRLGAPGRPDVRLRRHRRHGEDELEQGRRADPDRRARGHGGAGAALALRPSPAQPELRRRVRSRAAAPLRRVGCLGPQGRRRLGPGRRPRRAPARHVDGCRSAADDAATDAVPHHRVGHRRHPG